MDGICSLSLARLLNLLVTWLTPLLPLSDAQSYFNWTVRHHSALNSQLNWPFKSFTSSLPQKTYLSPRIHSHTQAKFICLMSFFALEQETTRGWVYKYVKWKRVANTVPIKCLQDAFVDPRVGWVCCWSPCMFKWCVNFHMPTSRPMKTWCEWDMGLSIG